MCKSRLVSYYRANSKRYILPNGSTIVWNEFGLPNGFPILHFHGGFLTRLEGILYDKEAIKHGFRMIMIDRPGCGDSLLPNPTTISTANHYQQYTFKLYFDDLHQFMKHIKIDTNKQFGVSGYSQGRTFTIPSLYHIPLIPKFTLLFAPIPMLDRQQIICTNINGYNDINNYIKFNDGEQIPCMVSYESSSRI